jgi:hypothetical protein
MAMEVGSFSVSLNLQSGVIADVLALQYRNLIVVDGLSRQEVGSLSFDGLHESLGFTNPLKRELDETPVMVVLAKRATSKSSAPSNQKKRRFPS